jgi:excisionase family DNA binding protein
MKDDATMTADRIAELTEWIEDIRFKLAISPDHPIGSQLPGALAELAELEAKQNHPTNNTGATMTDNINPADLDGTISVAEAAARLNVSGQTIRNWIRAGRLTRIQSGKTFRVIAAELGGLIEMRRETRVTEPLEVR